MEIINLNHNEDLLKGGGRKKKSKDRLQILNKESLGFGHWLNVKEEAGGMADRALTWFNISQTWVQVSNLPPNKISTIKYQYFTEPQLPQTSSQNGAHNI